MVSFYIRQALLYCCFFIIKKKCLNVALSILHLTIKTFQRHLQKSITFIREISFVLVPFKISCGIYSLFLRSFQIQVWKICEFCTQFSKSLQQSEFWISVKMGSTRAPSTDSSIRLQMCRVYGGGRHRYRLFQIVWDGEESSFFENLLEFPACSAIMTRLDLLSLKHLPSWPVLSWFSSFFYNHFSISSMGVSVLLNITLLLMTF